MGDWPLPRLDTVPVIGGSRPGVWRRTAPRPVVRAGVDWVRIPEDLGELIGDVTPDLPAEDVTVPVALDVRPQECRGRVGDGPTRRRS